LFALGVLAMAPEAEARASQAPGSRSRSRSRCLRKQKERPQTVNDPQGNDDLLISKVEERLLCMGFPDPSSALTYTSVDIDSSASGDAKAFARKALTDLQKHSQKIALAQKQLRAYEERLCQETEMPRMAKGPPTVPSTVTFTGGGRQPALGTNIPHAPFVSEGFDSYVLVVSPTGLDFLVPFMKTTTTQHFKQLVADIVAIDVDGFGLSFDCDMLAEDDLTMGDYGVENGATLGLETEEPEMTRQQCLRVGAG